MSASRIALRFAVCALRTAPRSRRTACRAEPPLQAASLSTKAGDSNSFSTLTLFSINRLIASNPAFLTLGSDLLTWSLTLGSTRWLGNTFPMFLWE